MEIYKSNRGKALTHMKQLQGGDVEATGEFINELKSRLRMKYNQLIQINEAESNVIGGLNFSPSASLICPKSLHILNESLSKAITSGLMTS